MQKYKLLKDLPGYKKGLIGNSQFFKNNLRLDPEKYKDWFNLIIFTTEDGVDMYENDSYYCAYLSIFKVHRRLTVNDSYDRTHPDCNILGPFSTEKVAEERMLAAIAEREGLKVGIYLNKYLLDDWLSINDETFNFIEAASGEVTSITKGDYTVKGVPIFNTNAINYPLIGFKDFKEAWEKANIWEKANTPEFEKGKWYKYKDKDTYVFFTSFGGNKGFYNKKWHTNIYISEEDTGWKKANMNEVNVLLLEETKRRFPAGCKFKSLVREISDDSLIISKEIKTAQKNHYWAKGDDCPSVGTIEGQYTTLYCNGMWAELVELPLFKDENNKYWYKSDLKPGKVFKITTNKCTFIAPFKTCNEIDFFIEKDINVSKSTFHNYSGLLCAIKDIKKLEVVTSEELKWFDRCCEAGKFIPKQEVIEMYGVYLDNYEFFNCIISPLPPQNEDMDSLRKCEVFNTNEERDMYVKMNKPEFSRNQVMTMLTDIGINRLMRISS
ncbi:MAG: hypothetical protein GY775_16665 [Candidatus Scalindua sp.]|nr:hypothetical protein [Candidatus Scalindua sp.]